MANKEMIYLLRTATLMRIIYCVFNGGLTTFDLAEYSGFIFSSKAYFCFA